MRERRSVYGSGILFVVGIALFVLSIDALPAGGSLKDELRVKYPKASKDLGEETAGSSVLLVDFQFKGIIRMNGLDGAAIEREADGELIRARPMKGRLVMFHLDEPGTYSLRFLRVSNPNAKIALEPTEGVVFKVTVEEGALAYLGKIVVTSRGADPYEFKQEQDLDQEIEAWTQFTKKYKKGPWVDLADQKLAELENAGGS